MSKRTTLDIGSRARAARAALGLNQSEVAERVGISVEVYGRLERGLITPRVVTLIRLCDVLQVDPNALIGNSATPRNQAGTTIALTPQIRQLVSVLDHADRATIDRVIQVARWLTGSRRAKRK
jgi:transcriptional regulator with XRE-family HTH domain